MREVFHEVIEALVLEPGGLLDTFCLPKIEARVELYAEDIAEKGAPLDKSIGFIDCTKKQMSRPGGRKALQRATYSGHKRFHCLISQTVTTPDGLVFQLYGTEVGRRHDMTLYRESGLSAVLAEGMVIGGKQFCIYGDAVYMLGLWIQVAYPRKNATVDELAYKAAISAVKEVVEWT